MEGPEPRFARLGADARALVEGVDEVFGSVVFLDEKVAGHADAVERNAEPAPDLDQNNRQRDRHADSPFEHLVEEGVPRVVVVGSIAREALVDEHMMNERIDG